MEKQHYTRPNRHQEIGSLVLEVGTETAFVMQEFCPELAEESAESYIFWGDIPFGD